MWCSNDNNIPRSGARIRASLLHLYTYGTANCPCRISANPAQTRSPHPENPETNPNAAVPPRAVQQPIRKPEHPSGRSEYPSCNPNTPPEIPNTRPAIQTHPRKFRASKFEPEHTSGTSGNLIRNQNTTPEFSEGAIRHQNIHPENPEGIIRNRNIYREYPEGMFRHRNAYPEYPEGVFTNQNTIPEIPTGIAAINKSIRKGGKAGLTLRCGGGDAVRAICRVVALFCFALTASPAQAQYHPQYSQYMFTGLSLNPAYAGSQEVLSVAVLQRTSQWGSAVEGAPATQSVAGDFPLRDPRVALGVLVYNDRIGVYRQTGSYVAYAYRVKAGAGRLSLGLQAGFDFHREDGRDIMTLQPDDPLFTGEWHRAFMPNAGVGAYYYAEAWFAGLSLPHLLAWRQVAGEATGRLTLANTMLYGGLTVSAGEGFKVRPSALLQYAGTGFLFDLNCNVIFLDDRLEVGVSLRSTNTLVGMAQFKVKSFRIGYAYDHALGKPGAINMSHEMMLRYDLKFVVNAVSPLDLN